MTQSTTAPTATSAGGDAVASSSGGDGSTMAATAEMNRNDSRDSSRSSSTIGHTDTRSKVAPAPKPLRSSPKKDDDNVSVASSSFRQMPGISASYLRTHRPSIVKLDESVKWRKEAEKWQDQYERGVLNHRREIALLEEKLHKLDSNLQNSIKERNNLASIAAAKEREMAELLSRQTALRSNLEKSDRVSVSLQERVVKGRGLERKLGEMEKVSGRMREMVGEKEGVVERLRRERDDVRATVDELKARVEALIIEGDRRMEELRDVESAKVGLETRVKELELLVEKVERDGGEREREREKKVLEGYVARLKELEEKEDRMSREKIDLEVRLEGLGKALGIARVEGDADRKKVEELERLVGEVEERAKEVELQRVEAEKGRDAAVVKLREVETRLKEVEEARAIVVRDREAVEKQRVEAIRENARLQDLLSDAGATRADLERQVAELSAARATDSDEYHDVVSTMKAAIARLQDENEGEKVKHQNEIAELNLHRQVAMEQLLDLQHKIDLLEREGDDTKVMLVKLKTEMEHVKREEAVWKARAHDLEHVSSELKLRVADLEKVLGEVRRDNKKSEEARVFAERRVKEVEGEAVNIIREMQMIAKSHAELQDLMRMTVEEHEARVAELNDAIEEERRVREGQMDMNEFERLRVQAEARDLVVEKEKELEELLVSMDALKAEMAAKLEEMESRAEAHRHEMGQLKYSLVEAEDMIVEYRERVLEAEVAAEEGASMIETLKEEKRREGVEFNKRVAALNAKIEEMEETLKGVRGELSVVVGERDSALKRLEEVEYRLVMDGQGWEVEREDLRGLLNEKEEAVKVLENKVVGYETQLADAKRELGDVSDTLHTREEDVSTLRVELEKAKAEVDKLTARSRELEESMGASAQELGETISTLRDRVESLQQEIVDEKARSEAAIRDEIEARQVALEEAATAHRKIVSDMAEELVKVGISVHQLEDQLCQESEAKQQALERVEELGEELVNERRAVTLAKGLSQEFRDLLEAERAAHVAVKESLSEVSAMLDVEREAVKSAKAFSEQLSEQLRGERDAVSDALERVEKLTGDLETERLALGNAKGSIDELNRLIDVEREAREDLKTQVDDLRTLLDVERASTAELKTELSSVIGQLADEREALRGSRERVSVLEDSVKTVEMDRDESLRRLNEVSESLQEVKMAHAASVESLNVEKEAVEVERMRVVELELRLEAEVAAKKECEARIGDLEKRLSTEEAHSAALEVQLEERTKEFTAIKCDLKTRINILAASAKESEVKARERGDTLEQLHREIAEKNAEIGALRREMAAEKQLVSELSEGRNVEKEKFKLEAGEKQDKIDLLTAALGERDSVIRGLESEVSALKLRSANEVGRRDETIRGLEERLKVKEEEIERMRGTVEAAARVKEELRKTQEESERFQESFAGERRELREEVEGCRAEVDGVREEKKRLQEALFVVEREKEEIEETLKTQVDFLQKNYREAFDNVKKLHSQNADLIGHNNAQQKIRLLSKMKEELVKLKE
ncbi:hypothetical protein HDU76_002504, partial [Blyttiomyces sp. JEL0837]